jgi:N-methylhydantoinase A
VERGHDPREFTLIPFGGAGGLHALALARALRIPRVMLPSAPGALSAVGVVTADVVKDQSRTVMLEAAPRIEGQLENVFRELERSARAALRREGFAERQQRHERSLAVRYRGQSFELQLQPPRGDIASAFHRAHRARYGYAQKENAVEIVSARLRSSGIVEKLRLRRAGGLHSKGVAAPQEFTETYFAGKKVRAAVYHRDEIKPGSRLRVPCIVAEYSATTLIPEDVKASADSLGNIMVELGEL